MSDSSPLFVSALELVAHATETFAQKNPKKYKFVVLHLANAIELILKDLIIDLGLSIYKNPKETITIWDCFGRIAEKGIDIPEKPIIELLIDDRNVIQHRFGYPDEKTVYYYLVKVVDFFQRFVETHYRIQLADALKLHLSKELMELISLAKDESNDWPEPVKSLNSLDNSSNESNDIPSDNQIGNQLDNHFNFYLGSALVSTFERIEGKINQILQSPENGLSVFQMSINPLKKNGLRELFSDLEQKGFLEIRSHIVYQELKKLRNILAHAPLDVLIRIDEKITENRLKDAKRLEEGFDKAIRANYKFLLPEEESQDKP